MSMRTLPIILFIVGLASIAVAPAHADDAKAQPRRVFIAGDSTAAEYGPERAPRNGWGQQLQGFLDPAYFEVRNHAMGGRSSRSFIEEGRLDPVARELRKGDVLLIQFGHNDEKSEDPTRYNEPTQAYPQWLMRYVAAARERGATPILLTPVSRRVWDFGSLLDTHARYTQAVRELAAREKVALIDLNASSTDWLRALAGAPQSVSRTTCAASAGSSVFQSRTTRQATMVAPATLKWVSSRTSRSGTCSKYAFDGSSPSARSQSVLLALRSISATCSRAASSRTAWV